MSDVDLSDSGNKVWLAVNTQPHREALAIENLKRQEFLSYCPMIRMHTVRHEVLRPMFSGYIFVMIKPSQRWHPVHSTLGVRRILSFGGKPSLVADEFIQALRAREIDGAVVRPAEPYEIGQKVRVTAGPFDGIIASIVDMKEADRIVVLIELLGRNAKASIDIRSLASVDV